MEVRKLFFFSCGVWRKSLFLAWVGSYYKSSQSTRFSWLEFLLTLLIISQVLQAIVLTSIKNCLSFKWLRNKKENIFFNLRSPRLGEGLHSQVQSARISHAHCNLFWLKTQNIWHQRKLKKSIILPTWILTFKISFYQKEYGP